MRATTLATVLFGATAIFAASCSSSSNGADLTAPTISSAIQNRNVDPAGFTIDIRMSESIDPLAANQIASWTASAGNILTSTLQPDGFTVRLVMDTVTIPGSVTFGAAAGLSATGNIDLTAQVTDGDTVTVSDGVTAYTFEFTSGGGATAGNIEVDKGASAADAIAAFIVAFNNQPFNITAAAGAGDSADLTNDIAGDNGNVAITESDAGNVITLVGLAGGGGIKDLFGNTVPSPIAGVALVPDSFVLPTATANGNTIEGMDNDQIVVVFDDDMIQADVENPANWSFEAPIGTAFDLTNAVFNYDAITRTVTVTLGNTVPGVASANGHNLQTFDTTRVIFSNIRNLSGNAIASTPVDGMSMGDNIPPSFTSVWADGIADEVNVRFSESVLMPTFGDLYAGGLDDGARFLLTDADNTPATPAMGTITFAGDPLDTETFTISDGAGNTEIFEFDDNASVTGGNISIAITAGNNNMMATDTQLAIAGSSLAITAADVGSDVNLTNNAAGLAGNVAITGTPTNVTLAGMANGTADIPGLATLEAPNYAFSPDQSGAVIDYDIVPVPGTDTISLYGITDLAGNQAFAMQAFPVSTEDPNPPAIDAGNSSLDVFEGNNNDTIIVRFDRNMSPFNILEPSNYDAAPLDLTNASFSFNGTNEVIIDLDRSMASNVQFGTNYNLTLVDNISTPFYTVQGIALGGNDVQVLAGTGDNAAIATATAYVGPASLPNACICVFPEATDITGAMNTANYAISAVNPTLVEQLSPRAFRLTFPTQPAAAQILDIEVAAATDLGGIPAAGQLNIALTAEDVTPPTASFTPTAFDGVINDYFFVDYNESVDQITALDFTNYTFIHNGLLVDLTNAVFSYDSTNFRVQIELPSDLHLQFGAICSLSIVNVTDLSSNVLAVQPVDANVAGDNTDPNFFAPDSAFVNLIRDNTGNTIDVRFSEGVNEIFVENPFNWTTSGATVVNSVTLISPNIARVVTNAPIGAGETLSLNNLPDLAGNSAGGVINVDPQE